MAYEELTVWGDDELGHLLFLLENTPTTSPNEFVEKVAAIKEILAARGLWYCYHDESVQQLERCSICGRHYTYLENPDAT